MPNPLKVSRASFLKLCSIAIAGVLIERPAISRWSGFFAGFGRSLRSQDATAELFKRHLTETFVVRLPDRRTKKFVLAEVTERPTTKGFEQFSLVFHGPADDRLADGSYRFEHASLGKLDLFVVAVGRGKAERTTYEACFSRRSDAAVAVSRAA